MIEVKNWKNLDFLAKENPFDSIKQKADLLKTFLNENLKEIPINIEHRVVFPSISSEDGEKFFKLHPVFKRYENHVFFRDDLLNRERFRRFFNSSLNIVPTKEQFINVVRLLTVKSEYNESDIVPLLSKSKISFFDYKQLSVLNGYTGGFRVIRGVAGTGKTVILINFIVSRPDEKFLVLCFNKKLKETIDREVNRLKVKSNVNIYSLFEFLGRIGFNFKKFNLTERDSLERYYEVFETEDAIYEFRKKLKWYLKFKPISIFLCDETQDMPPAFMRVLLDEIKNCIFFVDEGQKFYPYTMNSVRDIFYHPKFEEKISMRGRVKNLKTIYRTPSNLAKCSLEILSLDERINDYYRKAKYIEGNLLSDINCILEEGEIFIGNFHDFDVILDIVKSFSNDKRTYILTYTKNIAHSINKMLRNKGFVNVRAFPMQAVKGLEAENVIIHDFDYFLLSSFKNPKEKEILFRKVYVLMTRAREQLFLSVRDNLYSKLQKIEDLNKIMSILSKYAKLYEVNGLPISCVEGEDREEEKNSAIFDFQLVKDIAELTSALLEIGGHIFNLK